MATSSDKIHCDHQHSNRCPFGAKLLHTTLHLTQRYQNTLKTKIESLLQIALCTSNWHIRFTPLKIVSSDIYIKCSPPRKHWVSFEMSRAFLWTKENFPLIKNINTRTNSTPFFLTVILRVILTVKQWYWSYFSIISWELFHKKCILTNISRSFRLPTPISQNSSAQQLISTSKHVIFGHFFGG